MLTVPSSLPLKQAERTELKRAALQAREQQTHKKIETKTRILLDESPLNCFALLNFVSNNKNKLLARML